MPEQRQGSRVLRDSGAFTAAQFGGQAALALAGFLVARILGPLSYGTWRLLNLILTYSSYIQCGLLNAVNRERPIKAGEGDHEGESALLNVSFGSLLVLAAAGAAGYLAVSFQPGLLDDFRVGFRFFAAVLVLRMIYEFYQVYLRTGRCFQSLSRVHFAMAVIGAAFNVGLAYAFGLRGLFAAVLITAALSLAVIIRVSGYRPRISFERRLTVDLMRIGFPILLVGLAYELLVTTDSLMIVSVLGREALGLYAVGLMAARLVELFPAALSQVIYPTLGRIYGQSGRDIAGLEHYVKIPTILLAHIVPLAGGLLFLGFPLLVRVFLPQYEEAIDAGRILLASVFFRGLVGVTAGFLTVVDKQRQYLAILSLALVVNIGLNASFLAAGWGIVGVALGTAVSYLVYSLVLLGYVSTHFRPQGKRGPDTVHLVRLYLPVICSLIALPILEWSFQSLATVWGWSAPLSAWAVPLCSGGVYCLIHLGLLSAARAEVVWLLELLGISRLSRRAEEGGPR